MPNIEWREAPTDVWLRCFQISEKEQQPFYKALGELIVHFQANSKDYISFVPERFVDFENRLLAAVIIADYGDDLIVDIPAETLTTGPRIRVAGSEKNDILVYR